MDYSIPSFWLALTVLVMALPIIHYRSKAQTLKRIVDSQRDTISRLINREPVTYQEVGTKQSKPNREIYAAWGNQMVDMNEDERQ